MLVEVVAEIKTMRQYLGQPVIQRLDIKNKNRGVS